MTRPHPDLAGRALPLLAALLALFVLARASAPCDLFEADQDKQVGYVMDLLTQGHLAVQYEVSGRIATKPPLYNWLAALAAQGLGTTSPWVMKLPSLLSAAGLVWIVFLLGRRLFGPWAGMLGAGACLASFHIMRLAWIARTDMLMVFLLHLAVYLTLTSRGGRGRSLLIGLALGGSFLAKGPAGPLFYLAWLALWTWHRRREEGPGGLLLPLLPGLGLGLALAGAWLALVWNAPGFQETVMAGEVGRRVPLVKGMEDPVYLYFAWLPARIAPWPLVAAAGLWLARKRPERGAAFFLGLWALVWLIMLSLVGVKRPDLILPVYPAVFVLAGLGLAYLFPDRPSRAVLGVCAALGAVLALLPLSTPWLMKASPTPAYLLLCAASVAAGLTALALARKGTALVVLPLLAGLIVFHGLHHHGLSNRYPLGAYDRLKAFLKPLRAEAAQGLVRAYEVHPLISYELGIHVPDQVPLLANSPRWLIIRPERLSRVRAATGWRLTKQAELRGLKYGRAKVDLYRVEENRVGDSRAGED